MHLCAISITGRGKVKLRPSTLSKLEKNQNSRDHSSMNKKTENATDIDREQQTLKKPKSWNKKINSLHSGFG